MFGSAAEESRNRSVLLHFVFYILHSMRKTFLFFAGLALLFLTHCTSTDSDQFTVRVTLRHLPVSIRSALLEEVRVTDTRIIDTAAIDPVTGKFTFTGFAGEEGLYRVKLE